MRPSSFKRSKFCILRAPTWSTSTSSKRGRSDTLMISVTMGRPVSLRAIFNSSRPSPLRPWKSYGEVRGLNAPPLSRLAPAAFTALATSTICSSDSTEQGPAIMAKLPPPIFTSPTFTTVSSGWNWRFTHLKVSVTLFTESTISRLPIRSISTLLVSPISPSTVW